MITNCATGYQHITCPVPGVMTNLHPKLHPKDDGNGASMPYKQPEKRTRSEKGNLTWQKSA